MGTTEREEEGALPEEDERGERSEGRTCQQGSDEVCLGYFGFLLPLCGANILSLLSGSQLKGERGFLQVLAYIFLNKKGNTWFR